MKKGKSAIIFLSLLTITILLTGFASAGFFDWLKNLFKPNPQLSPEISGTEGRLKCDLGCYVINTEEDCACTTCPP